MSNAPSATPATFAASDADPLLAWIEAGGTKFNVAVGRDWRHPLAESRIATADPVTTLGGVRAWLSQCEATFGPVKAVGIATFGPVQLDPRRADFGHLGGTPKAGWSGVALASQIADGRDFAIDTDVNAAALAEARWGAGRGYDDVAYLTVGTGIGLGLVLDGRPRHGTLHPEAGHIPLRRQLGDEFGGSCPFHGDCAEGLLSGPAILARHGQPLDLTRSHREDIDRFVDGLGQLCASVTLVTSVPLIVIGGGVMRDMPVHDLVETSMRRWLGGYLPEPITGRTIVPPGLGDHSGLAGAYALAAYAARRDCIEAS